MATQKHNGKTKVRTSLDIGSHTVKFVEIETDAAGKARLLAKGIKRITGPSRDELAATIRGVANEAKASGKEVAVSVAGPSVIVRFITMPNMTVEDLRGAIRFEAEKFIPFNINDCITDFQIIGKDKQDSNKQTVLLVAAKKDVVVERVKAVEDAGFAVGMVDIDSFAAANAFSMAYKDLVKDKTVAILNIGAKFTNLSILTNGVISFVRDVGMGGHDFNVAIAKSCGADAKDGEKLKLSPPPDKTEEVAKATRSVLGNLFDDIKLSFSYHENQSGRAIDEVYLSGGEVRLSNIETSFQDALGMKPVLWDPFKGMEISPGLDAHSIEESKSSFAVAVGLAYR